MSLSFFFFFFGSDTVELLQDASSPNRTLDLASTLEVGPAGSRISGDHSKNPGTTKSVMTIAFQFAFEMHLQDSVAAMARQYVRSIIASVQRVALALSPSRLGPNAATLRPPPGTPEAQTLARWISQSYRYRCLFFSIFIFSIIIYTDFMKSLFLNLESIVFVVQVFLRRGDAETRDRGK